MRIAILFSGRIRRYRKHYTNFLATIVQDHEADFFLSHSPVLDEDLEDFARIYKPKIINNEPIQLSTDYSGLIMHPLTNMNNFLSMWYNRKRVFEDFDKYAKSTQTHYDVVLSLRVDSEQEEMLMIEEIMRDYMRTEAKESTANTVFIPTDHDWDGINDQMAFGDHESMRTYMYLNDDIWPLMREQPHFGPETILAEYLFKKNMNVWRFPFQYKLQNGKYYPDD